MEPELKLKAIRTLLRLVDARKEVVRKIMYDMQDEMYLWSFDEFEENRLEAHNAEKGCQDELASLDLARRWLLVARLGGVRDNE